MEPTKWSTKSDKILKEYNILPHTPHFIHITDVGNEKKMKLCVGKYNEIKNITNMIQ